MDIIQVEVVQSILSMDLIQGEHEFTSSFRLVQVGAKSPGGRERLSDISVDTHTGRILSME